MQDERDTFVLVPNSDRSALLVERAKLPCVSSRPGAADVVAALRRTYSLEPPYLRPAKILRDDAKQRAVAALHEFDAPDAAWEPPRGWSGFRSPTPIPWLSHRPSWRAMSRSGSRSSVEP